MAGGVSARRRPSPSSRFVTLALGIGVTTGIYSAVRAVMSPPDGVASPETLLTISRMPPGVSGSGPMVSLSWPEFQELQAQHTAFSTLAGWRFFRATPAANGVSVPSFNEAVSGDYFSTLGVRMTIGRALRADDDRADAPPVAVISHSAWRTFLRRKRERHWPGALADPARRSLAGRDPRRRPAAVRRRWHGRVLPARAPRLAGRIRKSRCARSETRSPSLAFPKESWHSPFGNPKGRHDGKEETTDVRQGTLALMVLKTLDVLGPAARLRPRQTHRANQRRSAHAQYRHAVSAAPEIGTGGRHRLGAGAVREQPERPLLPVDQRRAGSSSEAETREWEQTTAVIDRFFAVKAKDFQ